MTLLNATRIGAIDVDNRVVMAPMTRSRSTQPGDVPNEMMAEYYAQRASAGMIITEATQITPEGKGYSFTPGIHSAEQIAGWKRVTDAVHARGGRIVLQLWHVGRMSHPMFHLDGKPVAPSAIAPGATVWVVDPTTGRGGMVECPVPRALKTNEIARVVEDYRLAARNAKAAGFDGVEIHAANGYLIDEFLRSTSNHRDDIYGGPVQNRIRFAVEVVEAVLSEMGADRTGIRFSPFIMQRGMEDSEAPETILSLVKELERMGLAYVHLAEADWDDAPETPEWFRKELRASFTGAVIVAGGYTREKAEFMINSGFVDAVAFGRPFIANPDLPYRFAQGLPITDFDGDTLFGGDAQGYTTYVALA
ncbi:alkene reductase [Maritalea sp. S77]|jgi:N-ethylmaleimide reductase|uniref:alkene reductase n=1 Tax=Maritalea sp. S77 TaxID=3415125 RepID=UPI003C7C59AE